MMKIIGHRGAKGLAPENTLASIQKALEHNVSVVEVDVHVTKDNVAVLHHDHTFTDPDGSLVELRTITYEQLKTHKPDLATLAELLTALSGSVELVIEIKEKVDVRIPCKILNEAIKAKTYPAEKIVIASFDFEVLKAAKKILPGVTMLVNEDWSSIRAVYRARKLATKRLGMNQKWLWTGFLRSMQARGYDISAYTINAPERVADWAPYLYGVYTDYPDRFEQ